MFTRIVGRRICIIHCLHKSIKKRGEVEMDGRVGGVEIEQIENRKV